MPDWPHAPIHRLSDAGAYLVTAGTYRKIHHLRDAKRLDIVLDALLTTAEEFDWRLQAWAVMSNHYHFLAVSPADPESLRAFVRKLHAQTSRRLNEFDQTPGRRVWYQFYDSRITHERSYFARLKYVNENPVHHRVIASADNYRWCSAAWFKRETRPAFQKTIDSFPINEINVFDPYESEAVKG